MSEDEDEQPRRRRLSFREWESGVTPKIVDRCGPKAKKFMPHELDALRLKPRVPLLGDGDIREEGGGGKKKKSSASKGALMVGDTQFKRWNVQQMPHRPEKEDEWDIYVLKALHYNMNYCDTYAELSGSKLFVVEHYDRGFSLFYVLVYLISCGILIQRLDKIRNGEIRFGLNENYTALFNGMWWNFLYFYAYLMVAQSFGVLAKLFAIIQHRIYFIYFSLAIPAMAAAYLWRENCGIASPWIMWAALMVCFLSSGLPTIINRMADPLADDLFFLSFLALIIQAICSGHECFQRALVYLLLAFAYAGPLGYWGWFEMPVRVAMWSAGLYYAFEDLMRAVGARGGPFNPRTWWEYMREDKERVVKMVMDLPIGTTCKLKSCEPGLYDLFLGGAVEWGAGLEPDEDEKAASEQLWAVLTDFGLDMDLSFDADDVFFWIFVLTTTALALHVLNSLERLSVEQECAPTPRPFIKAIEPHDPPRNPCPITTVQANCSAMICEGAQF